MMTLLIIAYLGGVLTILSPCILPVLPFVLARMGQSFMRSTLPLLTGMATAFCLVATLAAVGGSWAVAANQYGRLAALVLLGLFGASLIFPRMAITISRPATALGDRLVRTSAKLGTVAGSVVLGVATGLLWTPCAGPILGLVLTGAALQGANSGTTFLLLAYAAGAATSLALVMFAGGKVFNVLKRSMGSGERVRQVGGAAVLAGIVVIGLGLDVSLLAKLSYASTTALEQGVIGRFREQVSPEGRNPSTVAISTGGFHSDLPVRGPAPALDGAVEWLNSGPLAMDELRGKVVLVDFWTYSCINCIRTMPYVRAWAERYRDKGLVVIGVHAPEFAFEKKIDNVRKAVEDFGISYPVAIDNDYRIWRAFRNSYWPAHYLIDADGNVRYEHFGEGDYGRTEQAIQDLLRETGRDLTAATATMPQASGAEAGPDLANIRSGETYIGYQRATGFASAGRLRAGTSAQYSVRELELNQWGLSGAWTISAEHAVLDQQGGAIAYRFSARDLHLVLGSGSGGEPVRFTVTVDGMAPGADHGADIDAEGNGVVSSTRLYQLIRQTGDIRARTFEIRFHDPGAEAYAFTFG